MTHPFHQSTIADPFSLLLNVFQFLQASASHSRCGKNVMIGESDAHFHVSKVIYAVG